MQVNSLNEQYAHSKQKHTNTHRHFSDFQTPLLAFIIIERTEAAKCLQAERPGTLLAVLYCALAATYRSSLGASRD